ncbi:pimeloyl-ACP methyl esterase BioG family protein [Ruegeria arenilitoris]|uniref:pimeloyl-ACP methyl esterase BioG family protein n=1 Tax=Ruegeria arenilitoris TaxID=1173585 RepID=UPI00147B286B|nr:pimeloyl-ACP methyl esterase BioG family protein [Ruegeria arenilitoris]
MKQRWLSRSGTAEVLLVFGGWALGPGPFESLEGNTDVLFVDDYIRLDNPLSELSNYDKVTLIAFSFGVASAAHWLAQTGVRPDRLIAVSGTLHPADVERGIAPDMIRATADQLSTASFAKFCRRAGLEGPAPEIDIDTAKAELHAVIERGPAPDPGFDRIWMPLRDRIISTSAQKAAWVDQQEAVRTVPTAHIPFANGQNWQEWIA